MRSFRVLSLGVECRDKATQLKGALTHWIMDMGGNIQYLFQPLGVDEDGQPLKKLCVCEARLLVKEGDWETIEVPFEVLGTSATDKASGFTGTATHFVRHINGCFHAQIQPKGKVKKTGAQIDPCEFDLRQLVGPKIQRWTKDALKRSKEEKPSPESRPLARTYGNAPIVPRR